MILSMKWYSLFRLKLLGIAAMLGLILFAIITPLAAQEDALALELLTTSIDPATGGVSLVWVRLIDQNARPVTNFNAPSNCPPTASPTGQQLLYEPLDSNQIIYLVDLKNGMVRPLDQAVAAGLSCPLINPALPTVAWLQPSDSQVAVTVTDLEGSNLVPLASYEDAYDLLWSPDGQILIYTALVGDQRLLMAHQQQQITFWTGELGLMVDYQWLPDSSALLVAYYTEDALQVGRLERDCMLIPTACQPSVLASFDPNDSIILTTAFDPTQEYAAVALEQTNERGELESDLYRISLITASDPIRLTNSPSLTKTGVIWWHDKRIYYIGSMLDPLTFTLSESAIYYVAPEGGTSEVIYRADGYYPLQILWATP